MKVLLVSGYDINSTNANATCLRSLIQYVKEYNDVTLDVLGNSIFEEMPLLTWKNSPFVFARRIIHWPSIQPDAIKNCDLEIQNIGISDYDFILVPHKPYEAVVSVIKNASKHTYIYLYELDPMTNEIDQINGVGRHLFFLSKLKEKMMYQSCNHIFHMECNRKKYSTNKYKRFEGKVSYLDFPLLKHVLSSSDGIGKKDNVIRFIYSGALDKVYRNPSYMLEVFDGLTDKDDSHEYQFDIFSKGNCEEYIKIKSSSNGVFRQHGYVSDSELDEFQNKADFFVNIGNRYSSMLPSKLIVYISKCKPIIHFSCNDNDACIPYLEKYKYALILRENEDISNSIKKVREFISGYSNIKIDFKKVEKSFEKNTPKWSAEQIVMQMRKEYSNGV